MGTVGYTSNRFKFIRISSHTPKNIQEGNVEIIFEDIDILSHPTTYNIPNITSFIYQSIFMASQIPLYFHNTKDNPNRITEAG